MKASQLAIRTLLKLKVRTFTLRRRSLIAIYSYNYVKIVISLILYTLTGRIGSNVVVSDRCVVGAACELNSKETLSPDTIIYGSDCRRYTKTTPLEVKHLTYSYPIPLFQLVIGRNFKTC